MLLVFAVLVGGFIEAWVFMMTVGMVHIHILDAVHPISYWVAAQFVLVTLPVQALGFLNLLQES